MKQFVRAKYEAPTTKVWEVSMERNLLGTSGEKFEATRNGYGTATSEEWD